ncbi:MAG: 50S ribosomal protein L34e [Nanoarchaeota archaeon]
MPAPNKRSRTFRRVFVKTPGGKTVLHYRKRKPSKAICAGCGELLHGVPRERPFIMQRLGKTKKRPERKFGGVLCSKCSRNKIKEHARSM